MRMASARRVAAMVIRPKTTPDLSTSLKSTGETSKDIQLHVRKVTGILRPDEVTLLYGTNKPPDPIVQGIKPSDFTSNELTEEEIENIVEHHAQNLLTEMNKSAGTSKTGNEEK